MPVFAFQRIVRRRGTLAARAALEESRAVYWPVSALCSGHCFYRRIAATAARLGPARAPKAWAQGRRKLSHAGRIAAGSLSSLLVCSFGGPWSWWRGESADRGRPVHGCAQCLTPEFTGQSSSHRGGPVKLFPGRNPQTTYSDPTRWRLCIPRIVHGALIEARARSPAKPRRAYQDLPSTYRRTATFPLAVRFPRGALAVARTPRRPSLAGRLGLHRERTEGLFGGAATTPT